MRERAWCSAATSRTASKLQLQRKGTLLSYMPLTVPLLKCMLVGMPGWGVTQYKHSIAD